MVGNKTELYGSVTRQEVNKDYTGGETSSATVHVNNIDRVITVDVNVPNILGVDATTAFPGHMGKELYEKVDLLTSELRNAEQEFTETTSLLRQEIVKVSPNVSKEVTDINRRINNLDSEVSDELNDVTQNTQKKLSNLKDDMESQISDSVVLLRNEYSTEDNSIRTRLDSIDARLEQFSDTYATQNSLKSVQAQLSDLPNIYATKEELLLAVQSAVQLYFTKTDTEAADVAANMN